MPKKTKKKTKKKGKKKVRKHTIQRPGVLPMEPTTLAQSMSDNLMLFYGPPGVGKTTFVNGMPGRVLFLSTDRGTRSQNAMRTELHTWKEVGQALTALEKLPVANFPYSIICVDHLTDLCDWVEDAVCEKLELESLADAEWGAGWKAYRKGIQSMLQRLLRLPCGIVFIAHEAVKEIQTRGTKISRTQPQMMKTAWNQIMPMLDLVGYLGFRRVQKKPRGSVEIRTLETNPREALYCKDRTKRNRPGAGYDILPADLSGSKTFANTF